jgi:hypothetical protein
MSAKQEHDEGMKDEHKPIVEESPSEKLEDERQPGSQIPGAQNPESEEVKKEINPNTE